MLKIVEEEMEELLVSTFPIEHARLEKFSFNFAIY